MSLWSKTMRDVTFDDLDEFCRAGHQEGLQLDYKKDIPRDLAKTVAAFANTRGGIILFGVDADKTDNKPIWPGKGMPAKPGYSEQITQLCRDGIYPSVLPECSAVLIDPTDSDSTFLVARVHESQEAPHSIRNRKHVYVRTGDVSDPIDFAQIDRIAMLLERRKETDQLRERLIARSLARARRHFATDDPFYWLSFVPEFPHGDLFTLEDCQVGVFGGGDHKVPDGYASFMFHEHPGQPADRPRDRAFSGAGREGDLFHAYSYRKENEHFLQGPHIARRTLEFIQHCQAFHWRHAKSAAGLIRFSIGFENVLLREMAGFHDSYSHGKFPDPSFRADRTVSLAEVMDAQGMHDLAFSVIAEAFHGFDLREPPRAQDW